MKKILRIILQNLEYAIIVIPIVIAGFQIYFSQFDNLSAWKGGGFGMYTEPHPLNYRIAFIVSPDGSGDDNEVESLIVYPPLNKTTNFTLLSKNPAITKHLSRISAIVLDRITFPSHIDSKSLEVEIAELKKIMNEDDSSSPLNLLYSNDCLKLLVLEIFISSDYKSIERKMIYQTNLCLTN